MKKITVIFISCVIALSPLINIGDFSYSESESPTWVYVTQQNTENQRAVVIGAIKAYLDGRGYNNIFTYNVEKAIVQWSYNNWDKFAKQKGYNGLSDLNNHIAYRYNSNGKLQFFLDNSALHIMNEIYTAILEYYQIGANENKQIYNGKYFTDNTGYKCYCYIINDSIDISNASGSSYAVNSNTLYSSIGTLYLYRALDIYNLIIDSNITITFPLTKYDSNDSSFTHTFYKNTGSNVDNIAWTNSPSATWNKLYGRRGNYYYNGTLAIFYQASTNTYLLGSENIRCTDSAMENIDNYYFYYVQRIKPNNPVDASISAAQAGLNAGIVAAGKGAAITTGKDGANALKDYIEDNDSTDDDVIVPVDDPTTPPEDDPSGGTPPDYNDTGGILTPDGNGGYNFNFKMPTLNINWQLDINPSNLPFPFSIPSDFYKAFQVIDVEPEAPDFSQDIDINFGNKHYTWEFECNFEDYDIAESLANIHRKLFLFVYIILLIVATRSVMHIY